MKSTFYTQPIANIIKTDVSDLLTSSLTLTGFTVGEEDGVGDLTKWRG